MSAKVLYNYCGVEYTLTELAKISHLHRDTIRRRLDLGMSLEHALELPAGRNLPKLAKDDIGKQVPVVFTEPPPVFEEMQPILGKQYMATICGSTRKTALCSVFYVITLESGKRLITYPGEVNTIEQPKAPAKKRAKSAK